MDLEQNTPAIQAQAISVTLDGQQVLGGLDLAVHPREVVAVIGASGTGKTTLLHVLAALRPADSGGVIILGSPLDPSDLDQGDTLRRETVSFMAQDLDLLPELSCAKNAALPVLLAGASSADALATARSTLNALGLGEHADRPARKLSRGQRQRVALARALTQPRPILILDEPTASLDSEARDLAMSHLRRHADGGAAVLIATHDDILASKADRVVELIDGRLQEHACVN